MDEAALEAEIAKMEAAGAKPSQQLELEAAASPPPPGKGGLGSPPAGGGWYQ
jgi:hypothetical protein